MITLFSIKPFSGDPADGIDNVQLSVFSRTNPQKLTFLAEREVRRKVSPAISRETLTRKGSIVEINLKKWRGVLYLIAKLLFLSRLQPNYLLGTGTVSDIFFIIFKPPRTRYDIVWHTVLLKNEKLWRIRTPWWLRSFIFRRADTVLAVSRFAAESVKKHFPQKKIIAILNGVDPVFFHPRKRSRKYLEEQHEIPNSLPLVVCIGQLHPRKRPDVFIEIAKDYFTKARFVLVGRRVPPYNFLKSACGVQNFHWIEAMDREDISILLASSEVLISPSLNEASAAVILEAMASGSVPIVSESGGNPEFLVSKESGFLIQQNAHENEMFLKKLDALVSNPDLWRQMSRAARREAEKHSWDSVARLYERALGVAEYTL